MKLSNFQFTNPVLTETRFVVNNMFRKEEIKIPIQINAANNWDKKSCRAAAQLVVSIGQETEDFPYFLQVVINADFKWEENAYEEKDITNLLSQNAPALLLSYARPIIACITNASPFPVQTLPYFDFTK